MLELRHIVKTYLSGDNEVKALNGVSLQFRENEFVSILGASGCGKTTLLNIVGGLDRYTSGDLIINGISTKQYKDGDWDTYRNHSVGFVFQSYNLIPHQSVLANVELALTLSGVSKAERRARATEALTKVGLGDQLHKRPNQMSGGQMQRVAIARALVNNPDILLADEPTGALDTQTSVQIMELLKEVAEDRLVIMVTHNPELAEQYSTRIVRLQDGEVIDDTNPITEEEYEALAEKDRQALIERSKDKKAKKAARKKASMSFGTAVSLSFKNLLTKKGRTILTSFAGSIGIIGIALILSLSNGIQIFIDQVQEDTLSTYPLTIMKETQDMSAMMAAMMETSNNEDEIDPNKIYVDDSMDKMVSAMTSSVTNNLEAFKKYIDTNYADVEQYVSDIQYTYNLNLQVYNTATTNKDGDVVPTKLGLANLLSNMGELSGMSTLVESSGMTGMDVMSEMIDNQELLDQQYELAAGTWPQKETDVVLVIGKNNQISKLTLYMLGVFDQSDLDEIMAEILSPEGYTPDEEIPPFEMSDFIGMNFYMLTKSDFYEKSGERCPTNNEIELWKEIEFKSDLDLKSFIEANGEKLTVSGIIRPRPDAAATSISGAIGYTKALTDLVLEKNAQSEILNAQKAHPDINITTGLPHELEDKKYTVETVHELFAAFDANTMSRISSIMGGMFKEELLTASETFDASIQMSPKMKSFITYSTLLNQEDKIALALAMFDRVDPAMSPMIFGALNQSGIFNIDSREDLAFCLPSIAQDQTQFGTLIATLANFCQTDMTPFFGMMEGMLEHISLSKEFCVEWIRALAGQEEANEQASEIGMTVEEIIDMLTMMAPETDATLESTLKKLGDTEKASPASINFYAKDFDAKASIEQFIADYNNGVTEQDKIEYTDLVGIMMSSVSIIIDVISYVLIAFVSISLVVSSIMIGIITNISVLERTKEIGILRAIGASKKDISRVFNAETFIIGLAAGFIGIVATLLLCLPVNAIIQALTGFQNINATLPAVGAVVLILISMGLTMLAGLIPSRSASKKDPVEALRTE